MMRRESLAQMIIVLGATVGIWLVFVQPKVQAIAALEQQVETYEALTGGEETLEQLAERAGAMQQTVAEVRDRNQLAGDSSKLYERISALARAYGLTVQNIRSGGVVHPGSQESDVVAVPLDITIAGGYEAAAKFCEAVMDTGGFLNPKALAVTPRDPGQGRGVVVRFTCEALQFTLPEALAQVEQAHAE